MNQKLVLFDIDGTLVYHVGPRRWEAQYEHGMKEAYGVTGNHSYAKYNGSIERHMAWDIAKRYNITPEAFTQKFPAYVTAMMQHLDEWSKKGPVFQQIPDAMELVKKIAAKNVDKLAILTGNAERIANWKLSHTGYDGYFSFGMYGEEADDRVSLAKLVFEKAKRDLHHTYLPHEVVVLGDTVHDIRCGKAIGAITVAVTTGMHADPKVLEQEQPDFLVDSLLDPQVLSLFSLK